MTETLRTDVLVIGGGIAGLWLLARLRKAGYSALLLEAGELGGGQTILAQGIIHGGTKYALTGSLSGAANAIAGMPDRWRAALAGDGEIDLGAARVLSEHHYLWSTGQVGSRMAAFFASKAVRGRVKPMERDAMPRAFQDPGFKGSLYELDEIVLDVPSVLAALSAQAEGQARQAAVTAAQVDAADAGISGIRFDGGLRLEAQRYVFTAGEGNAGLVDAAGMHEPAMQLRPLHMVMVRHRHPHPIYAHCLGTGSKPRTTITSHPLAGGSWVWYAGGELAETGVERSGEQQLRFAQKELGRVLPWIDQSDADWTTLRVNRAEPAQSSLTRPDTAFCQANGNIVVTWPTKLALAPNLADEVLTTLDRQGLAPRHPLTIPESLPPARVARTAWEQAFP